MAQELEQPQPPSDVYARHRWIPARRVQWAEQCDAILLEHGVVRGSRVYATRYNARWRAQYLIRLLVELRLHERWELSEHVNRQEDGYVWAVEYVNRRSAEDARAKPAH